jgi:uncharacterized membrane protein YbhN (UPF0104 family)
VKPINRPFILKWTKILIGLLFLYFALRGIGWQELWVKLTDIRIGWLLLALGTILLGLSLKIVRWGYLLKCYDVPYTSINLVRAFFTGQAVNILLPVRGGEVVRLGYISQDKKTWIPIGVTIGLEKYLDLVALSLTTVLLMTTFWSQALENYRRGLLLVSLILTAGLCLSLFLVPLVWDRLREKSYWQNRPVFSRSRKYLDILFNGIRWIRQLRQSIFPLFLTVIIWLMMWVTNLLLFPSLNLSIIPGAGGLVLVFLSIGLLPALMPGNIGPFYFFAQLALKPFSVPLEEAALYAMLLHLLVTLPPLIVSGFLHLMPNKTQLKFRLLSLQKMLKPPWVYAWRL